MTMRACTTQGLSEKSDLQGWGLLQQALHQARLEATPPATTALSSICPGQPGITAHYNWFARSSLPKTRGACRP